MASKKTQSAENTTEISTKKTYRVKKDIDPNTVVSVRNGFQGTLIYISNRTGERFTWDSFGDEQDMDLKELKNAKNSSKIFFENNWFLIDDPEIIDYLGVTKYYENSLKYDSFDDLFEKKPSEIKEILSKISNGQKLSVIYRAKQLIEDGSIDSIKTINALENSLSVELIER